MKALLLILSLLSVHLCCAQNYQCLQNNGRHYYINGNGYLRGIRIDSVTAWPDSVAYYPFHTPRGPYIDTPYIHMTLDTTGGSWLGKRVLALNDGTFIFDSYWGDHVTIKTRVAIGSSWMFYSDSSTLYYQAQLLNVDTMSILGILDSVKNILITAHDLSGLVPSDPLDSFQIILSKNHGFVQIFDLYTFPYHKHDSVYRSGLDFFLDRSTWPHNSEGNFGGNPPDKNISIFKLVDFINPNDMQLHNWNTGDIFENRYGSGWASPPPLNQDYTLDTIVNKVASTHSVTYSLRGSSFNYISPTYETFHSTSTTFSDANFSIADTALIPETRIGSINNYYVFYFPADTTWCMATPLYIREPIYDLWGGLGGYSTYDIFKSGLGKIAYYYIDGNPTFEDDRLIFCKISGSGCGQIKWPVGIQTLTTDEAVHLYPNPATNEITITSPVQIKEFIIINLIGNTFITRTNITNATVVDISALPAGIYLVKINGMFVKRFVKE